METALKSNRPIHSAVESLQGDVRGNVCVGAPVCMTDLVCENKGENNSESRLENLILIAFR